jgi:LemA protein
MSTRNLSLIVILAVILILGGCACSGYNGLVAKDENTKGKWGNVQSDYQRRSDLIPNLVNTVKGAANFEQTTLTNVIEARAKATQVQINANDLSPEKIAQFQQAQAGVSGALGKLGSSGPAGRNRKSHQGFQERFQCRCAGLQSGRPDLPQQSVCRRVWF